MRAEINIKIETKHMYHFLMYHIYHGVSGALSVIAGALLLISSVAIQDMQSTNKWLFLFFGVLFLAYQPWSLYIKAARQVKLSPIFKQPLTYILTEQELVVAQGETSNTVAWDTIYRVRETSQSILVYTSSRNAFIWVKSQMGSQEAEVRKILCSCVDAKRLSLKKKA